MSTTSRGIPVLMVLMAMISGHANVQADPSQSYFPGDRVTLAFTVTVPEADLVIPDTVMEYVPGVNELVPGLERALIGMTVGERKRVDLKPEDAFGVYDERRRLTVLRERLPADVEVGKVYQTAHGQAFLVVAVSDQEAVIDFNHPLAGKVVVFDIEILDVEPQEPSSSPPEQEELDRWT